MSDQSDWNPFHENDAVDKTLSFKLDKRALKRLKLAAIWMGLSIQDMMQCITIGLIEALDDRLEDGPSQELVHVLFPWPQDGMDRWTFRKAVQEGLAHRLLELGAKGFPFLHYDLFSSESITSLDDAERREAREQGRDWALSLDDIKHVKQLIKAEEQISPEHFPAFLKGAREVVDAFERWNRADAGLDRQSA